MTCRNASRRAFLGSLVCTSLALATSCAALRPTSPSEELLADLETLLSQAGDGELENLCLAIGETSRALLNTHTIFLRRFNRAAANRQVGADQLADLTDSYESDVASQRLALLSLQDELHKAVPTEHWPAVRELLLAKGDMVSDKAGGTR